MAVDLAPPQQGLGYIFHLNIRCFMDIRAGSALYNSESSAVSSIGSNIFDDLPIPERPSEYTLRSFWIPVLVVHVHEHTASCKVATLYRCVSFIVGSQQAFLCRLSGLWCLDARQWRFIESFRANPEILEVLACTRSDLFQLCTVFECGLDLTMRSRHWYVL